MAISSSVSSTPSSLGFIISEQKPTLFSSGRNSDYSISSSRHKKPLQSLYSSYNQNISNNKFFFSSSSSSFSSARKRRFGGIVIRAAADYYSTLGVPKSATSKDIKAAYKRLARQRICGFIPKKEPLFKVDIMYTRPRPEERTLYVGIIAILRITGMVCIGAAVVGCNAT